MRSPSPAQEARELLLLSEAVAARAARADSRPRSARTSPARGARELLPPKKRANSRARGRRASSLRSARCTPTSGLRCCPSFRPPT
eukprot:4541166-Pleurochrysis_carterae.AAC.4